MPHQGHERNVREQMASDLSRHGFMDQPHGSGIFRTVLKYFISPTRVYKKDHHHAFLTKPHVISRGSSLHVSAPARFLAICVSWELGGCVWTQVYTILRRHSPAGGVAGFSKNRHERSSKAEQNRHSQYRNNLYSLDLVALGNEFEVFRRTCCRVGFFPATCCGVPRKKIDSEMCALDVDNLSAAVHVGRVVLGGYHFVYAWTYIHMLQYTYTLCVTIMRRMNLLSSIRGR